MAKHINSWQPDTCGCTVTYEWDDIQSEDERVHTGIVNEHTKLCPVHTSKVTDGLPITGHEHFSLVLEENQRKNKTLGFIVDTHNVKHEDIGWEFDENRHLHVDTSKLKLKTMHKMNVQDWANKNLGRVTIH